jgi:hypothetical protein
MYGLRAAAIFCLAFCTISLATAKVIWPVGWSSRTQNGAIVSQSPSAADGTMVVLIAPPAESKTVQTLASWFEMKVRAAATSGTTIGKRFGTNVEEGTLYKDGFELRQSGQVVAYVFAFAYEASNLRQFALILRSKQVDKRDPRVITAEDTVADGWRGGTPLGAPGQNSVATSNTAARPPTTPSTPAQPPAGRCHDEMTNVTTWTMQQVCSPSAGGMSNCHLESVPVQQRVMQTVCR